MKVYKDKYPIGAIVEIKSRRYGYIKAIILKPIPKNEWTCKIINPKEGEKEFDEFTNDEIIRILEMPKTE